MSRACGPSVATASRRTGMTANGLPLDSHRSTSSCLQQCWTLRERGAGGRPGRIGRCGVTRLCEPEPALREAGQLFLFRQRANRQLTMHMHRENRVFLAGTMTTTLRCHSTKHFTDRRFMGWQHGPTHSVSRPPGKTAMNPDSSKYGRKHRIERKRVQAEIAAGRGVCGLCGEVIRSGHNWSLSRQAGGAIHSRCGFERRLLGKGVGD